MKAGDRKEKIDRLKELEGYDRGILTNARCLAEGVDVPSLDGVAFIDPRGSQVDIIQAVGRAIRKVRGAKIQTKGTVVIPVFIEDGEDLEETIEESDFKPAWDVLKALRAHDEVLADTLDQYRTNMAKSASQSSQKISDKIIFDLPANVDAEFSSALRTVLVEASTASWGFWFGLLEAFKDREGHCKVPGGFKADDYSLGSWVGTQRKQRDSLSRERIEKLDSLGFTWNQLKEQWEQKFSELEKFRELEGHCRVPKNYNTADAVRLGHWVSTQRVQQESLSPERIKRLDSLDFIWDAYLDKWEQGFNELQRFRENEGHCRVPHKYKTDDGVRL